MPLLRINAIGRALALYRSDSTLDAAIQRALQTPGPIVIMVHGYKFLPGDPNHCPHEHIFSCASRFTCNRALSWPRQLGIGHGDPSEGLAIAFGWQARGTLKEAHASSLESAVALAALISTLRALAPARPVNLIAHSLGAHLVLETMRYLSRNALGRVILMNGATYQSHALSRLSSPAGRTCEVINVTSRENAVYDRLFSWVLPSAIARDRPLCHGIPARNALSLRIDRPAVRDALENLGYPIAPDQHYYCHWSTYMRPGLFDFYRALIHTPNALPFGRLLMLLEREGTRESQPSYRGWLLPSFTRQAS